MPRPYPLKSLRSLKNTFLSHPDMDHSELDLLVDAGKRTVGIQKVRCPLCRAGLVTLEKDEDEEDDSGSIQPASSSKEVGLVQLEEDDHIATHIHEFALHSFPSPDEATSCKVFSVSVSLYAWEGSEVS